MKINLENVLLYLGWAIIITIAIYLLLKIFGIVKSPSLEEILLSMIIGHSMILGIRQTKISYIENRTKRIERKLDKLLRK